MFTSSIQFQQDNHEEEVNQLLRNFTQDFVRQFEKKLIDHYQEVMGEIKKASGVPELVVQGLGTALGALGGSVIGLPGLGAEMGAKFGRKAGEKAREYAPELGRQWGERAWLGWLGEKAGKKAGEYAPELGEKAGEKAGRLVGEEVKRRVCDYISNIKDYLSGKAYKSKAEKVVEITAPLLLDNKPEFRRMLVEAAIDVFRSFESQFARITVDSGSMIVMRRNLAVDTVERVIDYIDNQKQNDPRVKISSELITKGVILGNSQGSALATFKFSQPGSSLTGKQSGSTWKTSGLYENTGLVRKEGDEVRYYKKKGSNTDECGHRLLLNWEEKEWERKLRYQYESSPARKYSYVLKAEDLKQKSIDILKEIYDKDSVLQLERRDLVDAAEEGARRALNIQQSARSSCFVMDDPVQSFTGRDKELNTIHETMQLNAEKGTLLSRIIVISGLGGMGKSELARKYAHKYRWNYDGNVIWINAEKFEDLVESFEKLAKEELKIPTKDRDIESIVKDVYRHFSKSKSLFIFDNVEKYKSEVDEDIGEDRQNTSWGSMLPFRSFLFGGGTDKNKSANKDAGIDKFLPLSSLPDTRPYFLITSRNRDWVSGVTVIELEGLELNDAISFVKKALKIPEKDKSQDKEIEMLVKRVDNYPLTLQQAVAYIRSQKKEFKVSDYLREYDKETGKFYKFKGIDNYTKTILKTWEVTINKIAKDKEYGKLALDILNVMAYFPADDIKREVFLNLVNGDREKLSSTVELLVKYSVVNGRQYQSILDIHRAVQRSTRIKLKEENREEEVLREALGLFRDNIKETNVNCVMSVWKYASKSGLLVKEFSELPAKIILQLAKDIRYNEAHLFGRETFELLKNILGPEHPDTLATQNNMAEVLDKQGKYNEALEAFQHVFKKREEILGPDHPNTLMTRHNMADTFLNQDRYDDALKIYEEVLDKSKVILGSDHPGILIIQSNIALVLSRQGNDVFRDYIEILAKGLCTGKAVDYPNILTILNNIAVVLDNQSKHSEALEFYQLALEIQKRPDILGPEHPNTLNTMNNMATAFYKQGKYSKALQFYLEVLKIREKTDVLGPDHPDTLNTLGSVAMLLNEQGRYDDALKMYQEVLDKRKVILGSDNPEILTIQDDIALVFSNQGKYDDALKMYQEVLDKREAILGPDNPNTLNTRVGMALVLCKQGKYNEALQLYQEVLEIQKRPDVLGPNNPDTLNTLNSIAVLWDSQGKYDDALKIYQEVLDKRKIILGSDHPHTLNTQYSIAEVLDNQGKYNEALKTYQEVLNIQRVVLGPDHPNTLSVQYNMARTLYNQGKYDDALKTYQEVLNRRKVILGPNHPDTLKTCRDMEIVSRRLKSGCSIQLHHKQEKVYFHLSEFISNNLQNAPIEPVRQGLYLPSFEARSVKIDGKCVAITRGLSQTLFLQSDKSFLNNLETSARVYERIAQGKQVSKREEREVFVFSKLLDNLERQLDSATNSLPSYLMHTKDYKTLDDLSHYIAGIKGNFAIHLVTNNHVVAIYRTGDNYAYFDSNAAFVSGLRSIDQLMQIVEKAVEFASYEVGEKGFLVEHFDVDKANKLLSSEGKQILAKEIKTERQLLAELDKELDLIKINGQEVSRVQLYDFGTKINMEGGVPLLINAEMNLSSKKFQDHLDKKEVSMTAREYLDSLKNGKNMGEVVQATSVIPFIGSKREIEEAEQTRKPKFSLKQSIKHLAAVSLTSASWSKSQLPEKAGNEPQTYLNDPTVNKQLQRSL